MNFKPLKEFMDYITAVRIPGADCSVFFKGEEVFRYQAGFADVEQKIKMTPDRVFNLYSATKPVTVVSALQLLQDKKFSLDDPISEYLPEFSLMYVKNGEEIKKAQNPITVKSLFNMTSGLGFDVRSKSILAAKKAGKLSTRDIVFAMAKEPLCFEPGTRFNYGFSHDVLGALIEVVSGKTLENYMKENIFSPLGIKNTSFHLSDRLLEKMAVQYYFNDETKTLEKTSPKNNFKLTEKYESGGAGLISTACDYVKFANSLTMDEKLLARKTINIMRSNLLNNEQKKTFVWQSMPDYNYGLGVRVMENREKYGSPSSNGEFGWGGAAGAYMLCDPEKQLTVFYAQHMLNSWEPFVHPRIRNLTYKAIE